jgi:DNA-binding transcriptional regulator WhiA
MSKLSEEKIKLILKMYVDDCKDLSDIKQELNISCKCSKKYLNLHNIPIRNVSGSKKKREKNTLPSYIIKGSEIDKVVNYYTIDHLSISEIAKLTCYSSSSIYRLLKNLNIDLSSNLDFYATKSRIYLLNDKKFEIIDNQDSAYFLGLFYADGSMHNKEYHLKLKLQEKDLHILESLKYFLETDRPIYFHKKQKDMHQNQYSLVITSKKIYNDLKNYGLHPNKTFSITLPLNLDQNLLRHFLRGLFDGDGHVADHEWNITGYTPFLKEIKNYLEKNLNIKSQLSINHKRNILTSKIRIRSITDIKSIYNYLYGDANLYLFRKKDKFIELNYT